MYTESQLDPTKEYVWILSDVEERTIKGKLTMLFTWTCKDVDIKIKEFLRICEPLADCRIGKLMMRLGWDKDKEPNQTPRKFFDKGLHIKAKPLKHWSELNSEDLVWKLNYDELSGMKEKMVTISDEDMRLFHNVSKTKRTYAAALAHIASHRTELVEPFIQLSKEGKFTFQDDN